MSQFRISETKQGADSLIEVENQGDMRISLSSLGASLRSCVRQGRELTLGYADPASYRTNPLTMSATLGRYANRIARGHCQVNGIALDLARNNGPNHLNGGLEGFHLRHWDCRAVETTLNSGDRGAVPAAGALFSLTSPDGDQGYCGRLNVQAAILLSADNQLVFAYQARTDAPTVINLANQTYWNLSGVPGATIHDHWLRLAAKGWLEVDAFSIPTGRLRPMQYATWDFTEDKPLALILSDPSARNLAGFTKGIDHCFMIDPALPGMDFSLDGLGDPAEANPFVPNRKLRFAGRLSAPGSTSMEFFTSQPGLQVYTGNFLDGQYGRSGGRLPLHGGICLEPQLFPDSPNQGPVFRSLGKRFGWSEEDMAGWDAVLLPGKVWQEMTVHRFT
jgi:aldose 1-epimerase